MFYYKNWECFCRWINSIGIKTYTAQESLASVSDKRFIVLKHDVETNVRRAFKLAEIEHSHGISGSYYVQAYLLESSQNIEMLKKMQDMGHEISYHYDALDANNGDYIAAENDFDKWIQKFKDLGFRFKTICQHGNPIKKRVGYTSNRDFFRDRDIRERHSDLVDMVVNYSAYTKYPYVYISDAGYMWKHITSPENNDVDASSTDVSIGDFGKLKKFILSTSSNVILSTHPHRWENSYFKIESKICVFKVVRKTVRIIQKLPIANQLLNRFYFLAKKI